MVYSILRVLINALAVATTLVLLPGIHVSSLRGESLAATYLVFGIALGLANAIVRPLLIFLAWRAVLWSMGLFALIINISLFAVVGWLTPAAISYDSPELVWITLGGLVNLILITLADALLV